MDGADPDFTCFAFVTTACGLTPEADAVPDFELTCDATGFASIMEVSSVTYADAVGGEDVEPMVLELRDADDNALMCCTFAEERVLPDNEG